LRNSSSFLDGDGSDYPEMMNRLVGPIIEGAHDFVISSRTRGRRERGSMNSHQVFAGYMVGFFLRLLYGVRSTDMGPFRAIRRDALERLNMREETYGWPLEMQMRAARAGCEHLRCRSIIDDVPEAIQRSPALCAGQFWRQPGFWRPWRAFRLSGGRCS